MDVKTAISLRKSVRAYQAGEVPQKDICEILDAARLAPSGKNLQNWHFLVVRDPIQKEALAHVIWEKNQAIAQKMEEKEPGKGERFRKFCKRFTMFYLDAPV